MDNAILRDLTGVSGAFDLNEELPIWGVNIWAGVKGNPASYIHVAIKDDNNKEYLLSLPPEQALRLGVNLVAVAQSVLSQE